MQNDTRRQWPCWTMDDKQWTSMTNDDEAPPTPSTNTISPQQLTSTHGCPTSQCCYLKHSEWTLVQKASYIRMGTLPLGRLPRWCAVYVECVSELSGGAHCWWRHQALFSGFSAHFQIWKVWLCWEKNSNKIAKKSEKNTSGKTPNPNFR